MKALFSFLLFTTFSFAGLLNAIAFTVNGKAATLYDIDRLAQQRNITKEEASVELIKELIAKSLAEERHIVIPKASITAQIKEIMEKSHLDREAFEQNLKIEGLTYDEYFNQLYMQKLQQTLIQTIAQGKVSDPTKQEKLNFFNNHINDFSVPQSIDVIQYTSSNKQSLINIQRSPLFRPKDVQRTVKTIEMKSANKKLTTLLLSTKEKTYSKIIPQSINSMSMFYISKIGQRETIAYEKIEKRLIQIMLSEKRQTFINNFFQDEMRRAQINYIKIKPIEL